MNQHALDKAYMDMAIIWGRLSRAQRKQVGALIVNNNMIISDGFNGTPSGFDNTCEDVVEEKEHCETDELCLKTRPEVLHAESNAILKLAGSTQSSEGATLYTTVSPCFDCSKLIIQSGIKRVVYHELYKNIDGLELLKLAKIQIRHLKMLF
jgi:dCMP deaminase